MHRIYHPTPWNYISHRYATEVDFQIYEMGPLAYYMADDFFIPNQPLLLSINQNQNLTMYYCFWIHNLSHFRENLK